MNEKKFTTFGAAQNIADRLAPLMHKEMGPLKVAECGDKFIITSFDEKGCCVYILRENGHWM